MASRLVGVEMNRKHPSNVQGKYYVVHEECLDHELCAYLAPENFKMAEDTWGAYVSKQPESSVEKVQCVDALKSCPVEAIRDDGDNKKASIFEKFRKIICHE